MFKTGSEFPQATTMLAATAEGGGGHAALQASLASPDASDEATHAAIHEIFESGGITATCFSGLDKDELAFVNRGDHGGEAAHVCTPLPAPVDPRTCDF